MDKQTQSPMDRLKKVVAFLLGEDKLDGVSFGERAPGRPWFWWRIELRKAVKALESSAPQVAVPEPVGWVKWFDGEASFQPRDAILPEDAKQHGWQLVGLMRSLNAPTAPAGNRYSPSATAAMQGLSALRSAVHCGGPWDNAMDDAYETVKAFINQQPVSDPDGFPDITSTVANDACWTFIEAMPHQLPAPIFNDLKPALYEALKHYHRAVLSAPAPDEREIAADAIETAIEVAVEAGRGKERATVSRLIGHMREYAKSLRAGKPEGGAS